MSWCAGCLSWWGPLQRGDLCRGFSQLLIDVWLLVIEVSTLNLILLTTQTTVTTGILPHKENPHGRAGNRTRGLVICSQKLWPLDHEAGHFINWIWEIVHLFGFLYKNVPHDARSSECQISCFTVCSHQSLVFFLGGGGGRELKSLTHVYTHITVVHEPPCESRSKSTWAEGLAVSKGQIKIRLQISHMADLGLITYPWSYKYTGVFILVFVIWSIYDMLNEVKR